MCLNILQVVDFLLWASVTMESSMPLLQVKYLEWRVTLYAAVCQAYFDCNASKHAEVFCYCNTMFLYRNIILLFYL